MCWRKVIKCDTLGGTSIATISSELRSLHTEYEMCEYHTEYEMYFSCFSFFC